MLIAMVVVIFGLVAVAQLVPASVMMNSNNRNDGTALAFAQREIDVLRAQPLSASSFADTNGVSCPLSQTCQLGDPTQPWVNVGCPIVQFNNAWVINFSTACSSSGYYFTYTDPNDPSDASYDVRWNVVTGVNPSTSVITSRRFILGVFRRGMSTPSMPVTLDVQVQK
jgi:Tfp pilus assembly protein PilV